MSLPRRTDSGTRDSAYPSRAAWETPCTRNRWKRILREAFRLTRKELPAGVDLVIIPSGKAAPEFSGDSPRPAPAGAKGRRAVCTIPSGDPIAAPFGRRRDSHPHRRRDFPVCSLFSPYQTRPLLPSPAAGGGAHSSSTSIPTSDQSLAGPPVVATFPRAVSISSLP